MPDNQSLEVQQQQNADPNQVKSYLEDEAMMLLASTKEPSLLLKIAAFIIRGALSIAILSSIITLISGWFGWSIHSVSLFLSLLTLNVAAIGMIANGLFIMPREVIRKSKMTKAGLQKLLTSSDETTEYKIVTMDYVNRWLNTWMTFYAIGYIVPAVIAISVRGQLIGTIGPVWADILTYIFMTLGPVLFSALFASVPLSKLEAEDPNMNLMLYKVVNAK